jgi:hypothetical protein
VITPNDDGGVDDENVSGGIAGVAGGEWKVFLYANRTCFACGTGIVIERRVGLLELTRVGG